MGNSFSMFLMTSVTTFSDITGVIRPISERASKTDDAPPGEAPGGPFDG